MPHAPKEAFENITDGLNAWETHRPNKVFANLSLDKFRELTAPSLTTRATIARLESELVAAQAQRDNADKISLGALQLVVNAIKGDPDETEDGILYEAMGYVRKSERKSGLHRGSKSATPQS